MTDKARLRAAALAARGAIPDRAARSLAACMRLADWLAQGPAQGRAAAGGAMLGLYWPIRAEVDSRPLFTLHSGPTCLPVVLGPGRPLIFRRWRPGEALIAGPYGTAHPGPEAESVQPQVVVVPLVGFDRQGMRLGYGGGFYDRTLEALRNQGPVKAIGLAFAAQESARLPRGDHDQPLDLIVTEAEAIIPHALRA